MKIILFLLYFFKLAYSLKIHTPYLFLLDQNYNNKKIIILSPGGFKGFYVLGLCKYIKENYDLSEYVFSGASAGAWNSLFLTYNGDVDRFINSVMAIDIKKQTSLYNVQQNIKSTLTNLFTEEDFDLENLYIGTTVFKRFRFRPVIYSDFNSLEDAIDGCMVVHIFHLLQENSNIIIEE